MLRVLDPGLYTLVVDLGRPRCRSLGVPVSGAADCSALALGNALVGNPPEAAALEISLVGPTVEADCSLACVVYGAPFDLTSDRQRLSAGKTFTLQSTERLHIGRAHWGMRAYLCVRGGIETPLILGSRSGLEPLRAGAELPCSPGVIHARFLRLPFEQELANPVLLRVLQGAQADWFEAEAFFDGAEFRVTPASNRMGVRLQGKALYHPERELVSEPVCPGTVQVTRDGQCILLGVDGQTIGGYPKIAQVISADLDRLGQLRPGECVRFHRVGLEEAEREYRRKRALLREWVTRLQTAEVFV